MYIYIQQGRAVCEKDTTIVAQRSRAYRTNQRNTFKQLLPLPNVRYTASRKPSSSMFAKSVLVAATALTSTALAAPAAVPQAAPGSVSITLIDAVGHEFPVWAPSDQSHFATNVKESISHVRINNDGSIPCAFWGVDGVTILSMPGEEKYMDVGPPQTIVGGYCGPWQVTQ
ncbi:uncharacterized protein PV09_02194 [Verruconis gallopava]|uniref:Uncharacterized protein n=1 Tax=Verruconis gallopava TaxID=253628 RepID=A0A0D1Z322_9PEZI|nr:uncharacterized protein PV09_02194 [Verruconis gallopava]KIW07347.1 hypothetical protein PV09_02194 [Verruconis gallopava]